MIPYERQEKILDLLQQKKFIRTDKMAELLFVSPATIRRDLKEMESKNLIKRVSGGAFSIDAPGDLPYDYTHRLKLVEKDHIAEIAKTLIKNGQKIFIDSSTTAYRLIEKLDPLLDLTLLTNSVYSAKKLCTYERTKVFLIGGKINKFYMNIYGLEAIENIERHYSDISFISGRGISEQGVTDTNAGEAELKRTFAKNTNCLVVLVDDSKFNKTNFNISVPFKDIDIIISNQPLPDNLKDYAIKTKVKIIY